MRIRILFASSVLAWGAGCTRSGSTGPLPSSAESSIRVSAGSVPADGTTPAMITVMVRDGARDPISGAQVAIGYSGTADIPAPVVTTGHDGSAVFRITAAAATSGTVTATATNGPSVVLGTGTTLSFHGCANGHFFNGMCAPSPFLRLAPALPTSWGGAQPTAFAVGDLDGNGLDDVVVADSSTHALTVLLGYGNGLFAQHARYDAGAAINGLALADLTGDAVVDLVTIAGNSLLVFIGTGDGSFGVPSSYPITWPARLETLADVDGDGDLDVLASVAGGVGTLSNSGGTFGPLVVTSSGPGFPAAAAVADLDGDGVLDVVSAYQSANVVKVRRGNGDGTFGEAAQFATGIQPDAVAIGDVDGDGHADVVTANYGSTASLEPGTVSVLLGNGDGTLGPHADFTTGANPVSLALANLDADGNADVVTADSNGHSVSVLFGTSEGTLEAAVVYDGGTIPWSVAIARVNADALPDLVVLDYGMGTVTGLLGDAAGTFSAPDLGPLDPWTPVTMGDRPSRLAVADVDGDGHMDLVALRYETSGLTVALGNGDGTFGIAVFYDVAGYPIDLAIADVDGDGKQDILLTHDLWYVQQGKLGVLLGNGDGTFAPETTYGAGVSASGVAVGDVTGDGNLDAVVAGKESALLLPGNGDGSFGAPVALPTAPPVSDVAVAPPPCVAVALVDLDGDGKLDLVAVNSTLSPPNGEVAILLGNGDGTFQPRTARSFVNPNTILTADLDGDGDIDVLVATNSPRAIRLLANGNGSFAADEISLPMGGIYVSAGDLDLDGKLDLVTSNGHAGFAAHRNDGAAAYDSFTFLTQNPTFALAVADLDEDGRPDVALLTHAGVFALLARAP